MPLVAAKMQKDMESRLQSAFSQVFQEEIAKNPEAKKGHDKMAKAIAQIAIDIVTAITTSAQVNPGIPVTTAGSPAAQSGATTAPGTIS